MHWPPLRRGRGGRAALGAALLVAACLAAAGALEPGPAVPEPGAPELLPSAFRRLKLEGAPFQRGLAHGRVLADDVKAMVRIATLTRMKGRAELHKMALTFEPFVAERHLQEIRGIAAGAGVPYEDVLMLNCWFEMEMTRFACRQVVALGPATEDGLLIHGRNLDWTDYGGALNQRLVVMESVPGEGPRTVLLNWPGMVGSLTGTSERGLTVGFNVLGVGHAPGEPVFLLMRRLLEDCDDLDGALALLEVAPVTADGVIVVSDAAADDAAAVEWHGGRAYVRRPSDGLLTAGNTVHTGEGAVPAEDMWLYAVAREHVGGFTPEAMQRVLADKHVLLPWNLYSVVVAPQADEMHVAAGAVPAAARCRYRAVTLFAAEEGAAER